MYTARHARCQAPAAKTATGRCGQAQSPALRENSRQDAAGRLKAGRKSGKVYGKGQAQREGFSASRQKSLLIQSRRTATPSSSTLSHAP